MATNVDTKHVQRRAVQLSDLDAYAAEIERIAAAEQAGRVKTSGNWTAGQILAHLAAWIEYNYTGFPLSPPPWAIRLILKTFMKKKYLRNGLPQGVKIPGQPDGTVGQDRMSTPDAIERLKRAITRLRVEPPVHPSPAFGELTHDECIRLNLRHAELHLGFISY